MQQNEKMKKSQKINMMAGEIDMYLHCKTIQNVYYAFKET